MKNKKEKPIRNELMKQILKDTPKRLRKFASKYADALVKGEPIPKLPKPKKHK